MPPAKQFTAAVCAWAEVFLSRSMRDYAHFMRRNGISMPQVSTLMRLYYKESCSVSEVSDQLGVTNAAASQLVDRLVQQELLGRTERADDRRAKQLKLTAKGRALVEKAIAARYRWLDSLPSQLSREQQAQITAALTCLIEAARNASPESPARKETHCAP